MKPIDRRTFIKNTAIAGVGTSFFISSGRTFAFAPNETVNLAIIGTGGRAYALASALSFCEQVKLSHICDVDKTRLDKFQGFVQDEFRYKAIKESDFRAILDNKQVDAVIVATPEHWHAPMAIMAMQAGKHVYVEKPCSHNLYENELLVEAYKKYGKVCQMGNQQRSAVTSQRAIQLIRDGKIGNVYAGKAWYANTRGTIGIGKEIAVPETLDWDLWQGPAPREKYRDNVHPYNWHWFKTWGTGEIHNNGTHELDICRWALNVGLPKRVVSTGGRLHFQKDDWQFYDTQLASYEYEGGKTISWEGKSCNGLGLYNRGRGALISGTEGSIILDRAGYQLFDLKGKEVSSEQEEIVGTSTSTQDTSGFDRLTVKHLQNFISAIRTGEKLKAPIDDASISTHMCHLGNIAQEVEASLEIDNEGRVLNNKKAMSLWQRTYEPGWEPAL